MRTTAFCHDATGQNQNPERPVEAASQGRRARSFSTRWNGRRRLLVRAPVALVLLVLLVPVVLPRQQPRQKDEATEPRPRRRSDMSKREAAEAEGRWAQQLLDRRRSTPRRPQQRYSRKFCHRRKRATTGDWMVGSQKLSVLAEDGLRLRRMVAALHVCGQWIPDSLASCYAPLQNTAGLH
jgi:hypothetical protein